MMSLIVQFFLFRYRWANKFSILKDCVYLHWRRLNFSGLGKHELPQAYLVRKMLFFHTYDIAILTGLLEIHALVDHSLFIHSGVSIEYSKPNLFFSAIVKVQEE